MKRQFYKIIQSSQISENFPDGVNKNSLPIEYPWEELYLLFMHTKAKLIHIVIKWTELDWYQGSLC